MKYLLVVWYDIEPELIGPFDTEDARVANAREIRAEDVNERHGLYRITSDSAVEVAGFCDLGQEDEA